MPFRRGSTFQPQETMDEIELCWCGSGQTWGKCHRERALGKPLPIQVFLNRITAEQAKGQCSHPDASSSACSGGTVAAHTLQEEGGLRAISEDGHVTWVKKGAAAIARSNGKIVPVREGIGRATTFPGFCQIHDATFAPAEQASVPLAAQAAFLLAYRTVAYERFLKEADLRAVLASRLDLDRGHPFVEQARIQRYLFDHRQQTEAGLRDCKQIQSNFDVVYRDPSFTGFSYLIVEFDQVLPVVASGAFFPEFDLVGKRLQLLDAVGQLEVLTFNLAVLNGRSILALGWLSGGKAPEAFAASLSALPDDEKANAAVRIALEWIENTCMTPTWWAAQPAAVTETLLASMKSLAAPPVCRRGADGRCLDGVEVVSAGVLQTIGPVNC